MINKNWPKPLVTKLQKKLDSIDFSKNVTPRKDLVLRFLNQDPLKLKVVIVGQDPYPKPGVANGRAFAVNAGNPIPASLQNIFDEIIEVQGYLKTDETLQHWVDQGVLLLNRALTTLEWIANAHQDLWRDLTAEVIQWLDQHASVVFVLWGNDAQSLKSVIKNSQIIVDAHPSPLSVQQRTKITFRELNQIEW